MKRYLGANFFTDPPKIPINIYKGNILFIRAHNKRNRKIQTYKPRPKNSPTAPLKKISGNGISIMF